MSFALRAGPAPGVVLTAEGASISLGADKPPGVSLGLSTGPASLSHVLFGANTVRTTTTTRYLWPGHNDSAAPTAPICFAAMRPTKFLRLFIFANSPDGNGGDVTYTLRVNGVPTDLSVTMASTDSLGFNIVDIVSVEAGDLIDIEVTKPLSLGPGLGPGDVFAALGVK